MAYSGWQNDGHKENSGFNTQYSAWDNTGDAGGYTGPGYPTGNIPSNAPPPDYDWATEHTSAGYDPPIAGYPPNTSAGYGPPIAGYPPNTSAGYGPPIAGYTPKYPDSHVNVPMETQHGYPGGGELCNPAVDGGHVPMEEEEDPLAKMNEAIIRKGFIRKVFGILAIQLIVTFGIMSIFVFSEDAKEFIQDNLWILVASYITVFVLIIVLACVEKVRRQFPANLICLGIFTLAMSWMLASTASYFDADEVLIAVGLCMGVTFIMFLFGLQTKFDFTWLVGPLVSILFCLIMFGFLNIFIHGRVLNLLYASLGAIVFSLFITVDVQLVVGKGRYAYNSEEYILAALNIYLDIVNLLLFILKIINSD